MSDRKKVKYRRTCGGKVSVQKDRKKTSKQTCALCEGILHGVPHGKNKTGVRKLAKSKRRPEVIFGGVLCTKCRKSVIVEAVKVNLGVKKLEEVGLKQKPYVLQAEKAVA